VAIIDLLYCIAGECGLTPLARRKIAQVIIRSTLGGSEEQTRHLTADRRCRERSVNAGYIKFG